MPQSKNQNSPEPSAGAELLASAGHTSTETELFNATPEGYHKGQTKYVVVMGTVMSGLGKGIFASSVAKLLKDKGLVVAPIKLEGYLNIDAGTLNPFRHGEVFVLDDGKECDMDLGTYERMLDQDLTGLNFVTAGQIYQDVLERERRGGYLGRDVQMIPHVTGEVKRRVRELAMAGDGKNPADVVFIEVGGTVGDYENGFYIEAMRELAFEEGADSVCFVALTYIIEPHALGEQKSKAAQLGVKRVMEAGIQPHIVACRATNPCSTTVLEKIAMFTNVPMRRVFSMHDRKSVYSIPESMRSEGLDREILSLLGLHDRVDLAHEDRARERWKTYVRKTEATRSRSVTIGVTGKYAALRDAYASIAKCVEHCATHLDCEVDLQWLESSEITEENVADRLGECEGIIVPGGFGSRGVEGKISCVKHCRTTDLPFLGICLGFQCAVIEFARNVVGLTEANSTEFDPKCKQAVISELPEQKKIEQLGGTMRLGGQDVVIEPGTLASRVFGRTTTRARFRHRYEVDPLFIERLEAGGMVFSGRHPEHPIMQILELPIPIEHGDDTGGPTHPYFIAGQFHPELLSRPLRPEPMFMGLLAAAMQRKYPGEKIPNWVATASSSKSL